MNPYILEKMALVGCGVSDTNEIAKTVLGLSHIQWDVLDTMDSFGADTSLTDAGEQARNELKANYDDDTLICLAAYVAAYRNVVGTYAN